MCALHGGKRRGADYVDESGEGKNDCVGTPGFSIEAKLLKTPTWKVMLENAKAAARRKENPNDFGIGIVKKAGKGLRDDDNTLVMLTLPEWKKLKSLLDL